MIVFSQSGFLVISRRFFDFMVIGIGIFFSWDEESRQRRENNIKNLTFLLSIIWSAASLKSGLMVLHAPHQGV